MADAEQLEKQAEDLANTAFHDYGEASKKYEHAAELYSKRAKGQDDVADAESLEKAAQAMSKAAKMEFNEAWGISSDNPEKASELLAEDTKGKLVGAAPKAQAAAKLYEDAAALYNRARRVETKAFKAAELLGKEADANDGAGRAHKQSRDYFAQAVIFELAHIPKNQRDADHQKAEIDTWRAQKASEEDLRVGAYNSAKAAHEKAAKEFDDLNKDNQAEKQRKAAEKSKANAETK